MRIITITQTKTILTEKIILSVRYDNRVRLFIINY